MKVNPSDSLRVLQVSDCHVSADPGADYRGQNADENLESLLPSMRSWNPDLILLTGDVSEDASPASYARVARMLARVGAPVLALPGNHDDPSIMQQYFPTGPWHGPCSHEAEDWLLVLLNSTAPGKISGVLGQRDLELLQKLLLRSEAKHILLALHHQPVPVNAPWIDRYGLENPGELLNIIDAHNRVSCVAWGHVHHDFSADREGVVLLGAPSAVANSLPGTQRFTLDPEGPACRWLQLDGDGAFATGLLRPLQSSTGRTSHRIR